MQQIEAEADSNGHSYADMMQLAGKAVANSIVMPIEIRRNQLNTELKLLFLIGSGNNGGDGLVAATLFANWENERGFDENNKVEIVAYVVKNRKKDDLLDAAKAAGVIIVKNDLEALANYAKNATVIVDALLGTGTKLPLKKAITDILKAVYPHTHFMDNSIELDSISLTAGMPYIQAPYIIAVDCPTGLDCDTGELDKNALSADETVTFAAAKYGHFAFPGAEAVGDLTLANIGIWESEGTLADVNTTVTDALTVAKILPKRPRNAHKGTFGKAFMVAGSINYMGAAYLSAGSAYRIGTGLVTVGVPQMILSPLASQLPEATWILLPHDMGVVNKSAAKVVREECAEYSALLVGPGIGDEDETQEFVEALLQPQETPSPQIPIS